MTCLLPKQVAERWACSEAHKGVLEKALDINKDAAIFASIAWTGRRTERKTPNAVYFISDGEFVKIGSSADVRGRLSTLQNGNPRELRVLHVEEGGQERERELRESFAAHHERREWFRLEGAIVEYLAKQIGA